MLIITCSKMNAQGLLGEIHCRVLGELCGIVTLVLLQPERWKKQVLVGWRVWNYLSLTDYGLESCTCLQLSVSSCYSGCSGDAPGAHPYFHTLLEKPSRAEQSCVSQRAVRKAGSVLVASWSFSDPHSRALCLAKLVGDQDAVVPSLMNRVEETALGCYEDRAAETWRCPTSLGGGYAATLTRLLARDFLMAAGIGHMTPGNAACVSEVMSKHP